MHVRVKDKVYNRKEITEAGPRLVTYRKGDELDVSEHVQRAFGHILEPCAPPLKAGKRSATIPAGAAAKTAPPTLPAAGLVAAVPSQEGAGPSTGGADEGRSAPAAPGGADVGTVTGDGSGSRLPEVSQEERVGDPVASPKGKRGGKRSAAAA